MNNQEGQSKRIGEYLIGTNNCRKRRPWVKVPSARWS